MTEDYNLEGGQYRLKSLNKLISLREQVQIYKN